MVFLGRNCCIINNPQRIAEFHPFSLECEALKVPIVDNVMQCNNTYLGQTYMIAFKEALCVLSMKHNVLVAGEPPKMKSKNPTKHNNLMHF